MSGEAGAPAECASTIVAAAAKALKERSIGVGQMLVVHSAL
jgi:hypothetical protein